MRAEDVVIFIQKKCLSHCRRFLSDRQMRRSRIEKLRAMISACRFQTVEHGLEFPNEHHVFIDPAERVIAITRAFVCNPYSISVYRNLRKNDASSSQELLRIHD